MSGAWWWTRAQAPADPAAIATARPPNVVLIVWDTVRADRLSAYGYGRPTTPWLDALAPTAVVYEDAIAPSFWTVPSHASLFTGLPVITHGAHAGDAWLGERYTTMAEWLGAHGYDTYAFTANPNISENTNLAQGFSRVESPALAPWLEPSQRWSADKLIPEDRSTPRSPAWPGIGEPGVFKDVGPVAADAVSQWLAGRSDPERPYFVFVNLMEAHAPRIPSLASRQKVASEEQIALGLKTIASFAALTKANQGERVYTVDEIEAMNLVYDASIIDVDAATQALFTQLGALGALDDTLVVLTSDHGENIGDHGLYGHNFVLYDSLVRVPLVLWYPRGLAPARISEPVSLTAVFGAVLDVTGLPHPPLGFTLPSLLHEPLPQPVVSELLHPHGVPARLLDVPDGPNAVLRFRSRFRAIIDGSYKLIHSLTTGEDQLYDRAVDPAELNDLAAAEPDRVQAMRARLDVWLDERPKTSHQQRRDQRRKARSTDEDFEAQLKALGYAE